MLPCQGMPVPLMHLRRACVKPQPSSNSFLHPSNLVSTMQVLFSRCCRCPAGGHYQFRAAWTMVNWLLLSARRLQPEVPAWLLCWTLGQSFAEYVHSLGILRFEAVRTACTQFCMKVLGNGQLQHRRSLQSEHSSTCSFLGLPAALMR